MCSFDILIIISYVRRCLNLNSVNHTLSTIEYFVMHAMYFCEARLTLAVFDWSHVVLHVYLCSDLLLLQIYKKLEICSLFMMSKDSSLANLQYWDTY